MRDDILELLTPLAVFAGVGLTAYLVIGAMFPRGGIGEACHRGGTCDFGLECKPLAALNHICAQRDVPPVTAAPVAAAPNTVERVECVRQTSLGESFTMSTLCLNDVDNCVWEQTWLAGLEDFDVSYDGNHWWHLAGWRCTHHNPWFNKEARP